MLSIKINLFCPSGSTAVAQSLFHLHSQCNWTGLCAKVCITGEYSGDREKMKRENIMSGYYMRYNPFLCSQSEAARGNIVLLKTCVTVVNNRPSTDQLNFEVDQLVYIFLYIIQTFYVTVCEHNIQTSPPPCGWNIHNYVKINMYHH